MSSSLQQVRREPSRTGCGLLSDRLHAGPSGGSRSRVISRAACSAGPPAPRVRGKFHALTIELVA